MSFTRAANSRLAVANSLIANRSKFLKNGGTGSLIHSGLNFSFAWIPPAFLAAFFLVTILASLRGTIERFSEVTSDASTKTLDSPHEKECRSANIHREENLSTRIFATALSSLPLAVVASRRFSCKILFDQFSFSVRLESALVRPVAASILIESSSQRAHKCAF